MKADTYFIAQIKPKLLDYLSNRETILVRACMLETTSFIINLGDYTTNRRIYYDLIKALVPFIPVIIARDELNTDYGIYVTGKPNLIAFYTDIFISTIQAVERSIKNIKNPTTKAHKRYRLLGLIIKDILTITFYNEKTYLMEDNLKRIAKEYNHQISTLRIKKIFYAK